MKWNPRSSRREFLSMGVAGSTGLIFRPGSSGSTQVDDSTLDPIAELIRLEVKLAKWVRMRSKEILNAPLGQSRHDWIWVDYGFRWPALTLAHLYSTRHPENGLFGEQWCVDLAIDLLDKEVDFWQYGRDRGQSISTGETPHYVAAYVLSTLSEQIGERRKKSWLEHENTWATQALRRPLGMTGGYHDSWRMTALYSLGRVLENAEWSEMAVFLFKRLLCLQTNEGFWEDGRHHGPSARFCGLMLPSLAWMYRWTEDVEFHDAAVRLADFMATFSYPDALTVGAFDGRNSNALAYFPICPGLELSDKGRAYNLRAFQLWSEMGMFEDISRAAQSSRDLARLAFYSADTCRYLDEYASRPDSILSGQSLPVEVESVVENHTTQFDGLMFRSGPWIGALSGQNSEMKGVFRLERESRIEIWHQEARLLLGGGHHRQDWRIPHANAILDTGYAGPTEFGSPGSAKMAQVPRVYYKPRAATSEFSQGVAELRLVFGHGVITFKVSFPTEHQAVLESSWEVRELDRLCLQLPLMIWKGSRVVLDGEVLLQNEYLMSHVEQSVSVSSPFGTEVKLSLPEGVPSRVHYPLRTGLFHVGQEKHRKMDPISNPFDIALVSCQWVRPRKKGKAEFRIGMDLTPK